MALTTSNSMMTGHAECTLEAGLDSMAPSLAALHAVAIGDADIQAWEFVSASGALVPCQAPAGLLAGLPFGVKDMIDVADMPTSYGAIRRPGVETSPASFDAHCVALLRAAGAVPIGKTVTTEFAYATPGPTKNPWNKFHTPGGSSSGSAAAVAAGMVPITLGTQTGGSMIRPAAFCGVVGFKPTFGAVERDGMKVTCESLDVIGWYGNNVRCIADVGRVLLPFRNSESHRPLNSLRIAYFPHGNALESGTAEALASAFTSLATESVKLGAITELETSKRLLDAFSVIMHYEYARSLLPVIRADSHILSQKLLDAVRTGMNLKVSSYSQARDFQEMKRSEWESHFGDADLILTTSSVGPAPHGLHSTGESGFNKTWSLLGWPCLHLPTTFSSQGLPLGVQLVGRPGMDWELIAWGEKIHRVIDRRSQSSWKLDPPPSLLGN